MAKVTITIEDMENGNVSVNIDPKVETFIKMDMSGDKLTSAQGYALAAVNRIREESKRQTKSLRIMLPKFDIKPTF